MINGKDIICITLSDWDEPKRSRHHIMLVLAKKNRVLFVERPVDILQLLRSASERRRFLKCLRGVRKIQKNLYVYAPPPVLPGGTWISWINWLNQKIILLALHIVKKIMNIKKPVLWLFAFTSGALIGKLNESLSVYYCNDPFAEQASNLAKRQGIEQIERQLLKKVNYVFVPSEALYKQKVQHNAQTHVVLHGVSRDFLSDCKRRGQEAPSDISNIKKPRIGYVGVLNLGIDYALLREVAMRRPDWSIVLVGPIPQVESSEALLAEINHLLALDNVYPLGSKATTELPSYLAALDVCLLPYRDKGYLNFTALPLKYFDYLAAGKPVVSNYGFSGLVNFKESLFRFAPAVEAFIKLIEIALNDNLESVVAARQALAEANTWEARLERISEYLHVG